MTQSLRHKSHDDMNYRAITLFIIACVLAIFFLIPQLVGGQDTDSAGNPIRYIRDPDIYYAATPYDMVEYMMDVANVGRSDIVYDLGCGDGRIVVSAALRGAHSVGIEIDPIYVTKTINNIQNACVGELATCVQQDMFKTDLSDATVIMMFLPYSILKRLLPQLMNLRDGVRIVVVDEEMLTKRNPLGKPVSTKIIPDSATRGKAVSLFITPLTGVGI